MEEGTDKMIDVKGKRVFLDGTVYDLFVSLPGREESEGAATERAVAEACGIDVRELEEVFA